MSGHVVLLGDSIFDNGSYVPPGTSLIEHLRQKLPPASRATLLAVDGARIVDVYDQLRRLPDDAAHLVVSIGGNDALWLARDILPRPTGMMKQALEMVDEEIEEFRGKYERLLRQLVALQKPLTLCTIYDRIPILGAAERTGLRCFNDAIIRTAFAFKTPLIDLRQLCTEPDDYSAKSPIEPSSQGGEKIAQAIVEAVLGTNFSRE